MKPGGNHILVRNRGRLRTVGVDRILWVEATGGMADLHLDAGDTLRVSPGIGGLEVRLSSLGFVRIHRSALVNLRAVGELSHKSSGDYQVVLRNGRRLTLTRTRREEVLRRLIAL